MLKSTKELIRIVEKRASEANAYSEAQQLLRQGADVTAATSTGSLIDSVIAEEKRYRLIIPWKADNCQRLIDVLEKGACEQLAQQVFKENGGDLKEIQRFVQLKASCYQASVYGPLGLLGSLLKQEKTLIRLDIVRFLVESDSDTKHSLTTADEREQTILSLAKASPRCPLDVIDYLQEQFDTILNQIPFVQPQIDPNEVLLWIRRGANLEAIDQHGNTVLANAVLTGNVQLVRVLVSAGSRTAYRNADGLTPLEIAKRATLRNPPLIAALLAQNVNSELRRLIETKKSLLTAEEVRATLENGADINAILANNESPLHLLLADEGTPEMVTAFVNDFNADLSAMNTNGYRPVEMCICRSKESCDHLLTLLKLPQMTTELFSNRKLNKTLLQFATEIGHVEAAKIIQNELNSRLWDCVARYTNTKDDLDETIRTKLQKLVACGAQIHHKYRDSQGRQRTLLYSACERDDQQLVECLVNDLEADPSVANEHGDYPMSVAAECDHFFIVRCLCHRSNSTLNLGNREQQTALHLATRKRHLLIVEYLIKWGADHQAKNVFNQSALDLARLNVSQNREEQIIDAKLIRVLEQLIPPPVDQSTGQSPSATLVHDDLDLCEPVTAVVVNPILTTSDDVEGTIGKQRRSLFAGSPNADLHEAARNGSLWEARKTIVQGADVRYRKKNRTAHEVALLSEKEYILHLKSTAFIWTDHSAVENMAVGCQQIASMIEQIAQTKLAQAIEQSNAALVRSYHLAGASLTVELFYRACSVSDNVEIVDYLLNQSGDIYQAMINDWSVTSPYRTAKKNNCNQVANYLK